MKRIIFLLLMSTSINSIHAQGLGGSDGVERQKSANRDYMDSSLTLIPDAELSQGERLFLNEAVDLYKQYVRVVQGIPKGKYDIAYTNSFVDRRFTPKSFIEIELKDGSTIPRAPKRYFSNLIGRYYGNGATLDTSSKIICSIIVRPQLAITNTGDRVVVCYYDHIMIDKRNGVQQSPADSTSKRVQIVFAKIENSPSAKINNIKVVKPQ